MEKKKGRNSKEEGKKARKRRQKKNGCDVYLFAFGRADEMEWED